MLRHVNRGESDVMLTITGLHVYSTGREARELVKGVSFSLRDGEIAVVMGPNGSGKSSLCNALMGDPALRTKGSIRMDGSEVSRLGADGRARKGMFLAFQHPEELEGVKGSVLARKVLGAKSGAKSGAERGAKPGAQGMEALLESNERFLSAVKAMGLEEGIAARGVNVGFSGGEKKRMEAAQMLAMKPKLVILDEIDSGLDVDGIRLVAKAIKGLRDGKRAFIIVTHYPRLLRYLKADSVHVLAGGRIVRSGTAALAREVEKRGYSSFAGAGEGRRGRGSRGREKSKSSRESRESTRSRGREGKRGGSGDRESGGSEERARAVGERGGGGKDA